MTAKSTAAANPAAKPKKSKNAYPREKLPTAGPLNQLAVSPDGTFIALEPDHSRGTLTLASAEEPSGFEVEPDYVSQIFRENPMKSSEVGRFAFASFEGRALLVLAWWDDGRDGPGVGAFSLDVKRDPTTAEAVRLPPLGLSYDLDEATRRARAKGSIAMQSGANSVHVSPDGAFVVARYPQALKIWSTSSLLAGAPPAHVIPLDGDFYGVVFDAKGERVGSLSETTMHMFDLRTGKKSQFVFEPAPEREFIASLPAGGNGLYVHGSGFLRNEEGKVVGKLPGEVKCGERIGNSLLVVGGEYKDRHVWAIDRNGKLVGDAPVAEANFVGGLDGEWFVTSAPRKGAVVLPWPGK